MKHNKSKIFTIVAVLATLCTLLTTFCSASWSSANAFDTNGEMVSKNVYFRNHLDLHLVSENSTEKRTYYGDVLIEDLGNTYLNPLEYYDTNTQSSEMETLFGLTYLKGSTNSVGYSYYQSSLQNINTADTGGVDGQYTGVGMTCYGFPKYNYTESHYYFKNLVARDYLLHLSNDGVGGQNIRVFFPTLEAYERLYDVTPGTDGQDKILYAYHTYNIFGYMHVPNETALATKVSTFKYMYGIPLPANYASLSKMVEPTTRSTTPYINIPVNAPYSSIKSFCERTFDVFNRGGFIQVQSHNIQFTENNFINALPVVVNDIDFAGTIISVIDNKCSTIASESLDRQTYLRAVSADFSQALQDVDFGTWIGNAVTGFFSVEILPSVTLVDILTVGISLSLLLAFLKMFAGG